MPRVTTYIRNADHKKWLAVPNKSEFIHNALNDKWPPVDTTARDILVSKLSMFDKPIKTPAEAQRVVAKLNTKDFSGGFPKSFSARKKK